MPRSTAMIELGSSSVSLLGSKDSDGHFRWDSIKTFLYLAYTYSSTAYSFDIFSKVCDNVKITDFIIMEATVGLTYFCMDCFIKQYTKRFDCNKYMNPLLRGISYGRFLQSGMVVVLHACYLADSLRYLISSFREIPPWTTCGTDKSDCVPAKDIMVRCNRNITTEIASTSSFFYYRETFAAFDRNALTTKFFVLGLVWILVFFFASVTEETIVKIFKLSFMCRALSTLVTILFILISTNDVATEAFSQILDISPTSDYMSAFKHVSYSYGIGLLGFYDFNTMSAYTMVDTASVIFVAVLTSLAFLRSWIIKILFLVMTRCVKVDKQYGAHVLIFAILPLTTEFLYAHKLYVFYFFGNVLMGTAVYMTYLTYIMAKFLSYEFRSLKQIYIVGLLCCLGFSLSLPMLVLMITVDRQRALTAGLDLLSAYLGGAYVAIVMWLYGLKKFCTDIQFWLSFKPTRFWTISWALLPVVLFSCAVHTLYEVILWKPSIRKWSAISWTVFTFIIVAFFNIKSMAGFLMRNNLAGLFKSHKNYGPPEPEDRKRRLYYSEYTRQRKCRHNCLVIDDWFDCNHVELTMASKGKLSSSSSEGSLMNLYDAKTTSRLRSVGALAPVTPQHQ